MSGLTIQKWNKMLQAADPMSPTHAIICQTRRPGEAREYRALTPEEYRDLGRNGHKLTVKEMAKITNELTLGSYPKIKPLLKEISIGNVFNNEVHEKIENDLEFLHKTLAEIFPTFIPVLSKMNEKSQKNHAWEKTNGIWEKIKWCIWFCFYDPTSAVKKIQERGQTVGAELNEISVDIKWRTTFNMQNFDEELEGEIAYQKKCREEDKRTNNINNLNSPSLSYSSIPEMARGSARSRVSDDDTYEKLTPKLAQKWLIQRAPDRLKLEDHIKDEENRMLADTIRTRLYILIPLWKKTEKFNLLSPPTEERNYKLKELDSESKLLTEIVKNNQLD
jgi:hypothetical protein